MGFELTELIHLFRIELTVFFMAAVPMVELRGAIPMGVALGMSPLHATIISYLGSLLPAPFILLWIKPVFDILRNTRPFRRIVEKLTERSMNKSSPKVQRYGAWGLILLVAVPLPGTGVWSGSLAAALLNIPFKWAFLAIMVGNFLAAVAVMMLSDGVSRLWLW